MENKIVTLFNHLGIKTQSDWIFFRGWMFVLMLVSLSFSGANVGDLTRAFGFIVVGCVYVVCFTIASRQIRG